MSTLDFNTEDLKQFEKLLKKAPGFVQAASASVLNSQGVKLRGYLIEELSRQLTIRNKGVPKHFTAVQYTRAMVPMSQQVVHVGAVAAKNFDGFRANEEGGRAGTAKLILTMARGGNPSKRVIDKNSLRAGVVNASMYPQLKGGASQQVNGLIAMLARQGYKGLVQVGGAFHDGIYRLGASTVKTSPRGGKKYWAPLVKVQQPNRPYSARKHDFMERASKALVSNRDFAAEWRAGIANAFDKAHRSVKL